MAGWLAPMAMERWVADGKSISVLALENVGVVWDCGCGGCVVK